jgi:Bacterial lipid A biosynthesis acyltransferase
MAASAEPIRNSFAAVADDRRLLYYRTAIKDFEIDASAKTEIFARFRTWLNQLSDEVVIRSHQRHYNPTYLNLLSVFGEELTNEKVHSLAIRCIKAKLLSECEYYLYLSQVLELLKSGSRKPDQNLLRLKGWDLDLIRSLLSRGRGLIICSFRFGAIRYLPVDLALQGFPVCQIINQPYYEGMKPVFESLRPCNRETPPIPGESIPRAENIRLLKSLCVEDPSCTVEFVDALKRNEIVVFCIEGNSGADGPWGDTSRSTIDFLGHRLAVKNGAARLAAAMRTPILPLVVLRDGDASGQIFFSEPIIPPAGLKLSKTEEFAQASMQSLYARMESYVHSYPKQWEGWSALHRWRLCGDDVDASRHKLGDTDSQAIARLLRDGKTFSVNPRRVAQLPTKDGVMWVDLKTLKGFQNPKWAGDQNVLAALSSSPGLDLAWINRSNSDPDWEEKIYLLLAYLQQSDLIAAH